MALGLEARDAAEEPGDGQRRIKVDLPSRICPFALGCICGNMHRSLHRFADSAVPVHWNFNTGLETMCPIGFVIVYHLTIVEFCYRSTTNECWNVLKISGSYMLATEDRSKFGKSITWSNSMPALSMTELAYGVKPHASSQHPPQRGGLVNTHHQESPSLLHPCFMVKYRLNHSLPTLGGQIKISTIARIRPRDLHAVKLPVVPAIDTEGKPRQPPHREYSVTVCSASFLFTLCDQQLHVSPLQYFMNPPSKHDQSVIMP
ncbi:hypothetical protein CBL_10998 [Carabus blaptoides fortunei]